MKTEGNSVPSKMSVKYATISLLLSLTVAVLASAAQQPQFDVATLKLAPPSTGDLISINLGSFRNGTLTMGNVTLSECIQYAYSVVNTDLIAGPDWITSRQFRYDIIAKAAPDTSEDTARLMLRSLLAERLKLTLRTQKREKPFLALVKAKTGPKLAPAKAEGDPGPQVAGRIVHPRMPMSRLAMLISRFERQTVIDMTGLKGPFSVDLRWTPEFIRQRVSQGEQPPMVNGEPLDGNGPSIYTAVQEQLGLRLEARKGPVDVLVVDRAEKMPVE